MGKLERAQELTRAGRFAEALASLPSDESYGIGGAVTRAELLERTGHPRESSALCRRLLARRNLDDPFRVRLLVTLGVMDLEDGRPDHSIAHLREAHERALKGPCLEELCWAELRLLLASFEAAPTSDLGGLLANARKRTIQLGDPIATIALHLFVSEIEAKKGALVTSRQHLKVAHSLLEEFQNYWLAGLGQICEFCLAYLDGDFKAADDAALRALRLSHLSGHARTELAAVINIAHIRLREGKSEDTNRLFRQALSLCSISTRCKEYVLDGLAQLALAKGHLEQSEGLLGELYSSLFSERSYPKLWSFPTRAKLLFARDRIGEARSLLERGISEAESIGDRALAMRLRLLSAEAAARDRDTTSAVSRLLAATVGLAEPSLELVAERNRVTAIVLGSCGDADAAVPRLQRSKRIFEAIGHTRAAVDVPTPDGDPDARRPDLVIARAAALFDQAARADLLAVEFGNLLLEVGGARAFATVATDSGGVSRIADLHEWDEADAKAAWDSPEPYSIELGSWRGQHWALCPSVPESATARAAFVAVRTLALCTRTVHESRRLERERSALWPMDPVEDATHGVFASEAMLELVRTIKRVAQTPVTILLTGETGTGKDVLARLVHEYSPRAVRSFTPFNCSAVPREMLDSQLFGHRRGAFTGAQEQSPGVIRGAQGGTLFLDEIGELAAEPQVKLLRFLESSEVHPIGEPHPVRVDVRVVAATNCNLEELVKQRTFREDLYYRLNVVRLRVPPLRERREEIPIIVDHYLSRFGHQFKKGQLAASSEAMEYLLLHPWPGNVRQLANELRRAAAMAEPDSVIMPEHLSPEILEARRTVPAEQRDLLPTELLVRLDQPLGAAVEHLERAMLHYAMGLSRGRVDQAAQLLGLSRKGLYLKRQRLGLEPATTSPSGLDLERGPKGQRGPEGPGGGSLPG